MPGRCGTVHGGPSWHICAAVLKLIVQCLSLPAPNGSLIKGIPAMSRTEDPNSVGPQPLSTAKPTTHAASVVLQVQRELHESPYLSMRQITCDYREGVLTLRGSAPTYYVKQLVQTIALRIEGVDEVANRITVIAPND
jgi:hypothetical protein